MPDRLTRVCGFSCGFAPTGDAMTDLVWASTAREVHMRTAVCRSFERIPGDCRASAAGVFENLFNPLCFHWSSEQMGLTRFGC